MSLFNEPGSRGRRELSQLSGKHWREGRARAAEVKVHSKGVNTWSHTAQQESWQQGSGDLHPSQLPGTTEYSRHAALLLLKSV